jgi:hypothetical protein
MAMKKIATILIVLLLLGTAGLFALTLTSRSTSAEFEISVLQAETMRAAGAQGAGLAPESALGWTVVALPLAIDSITNAEQAANYIASGDPTDPGNGSIKKIGRWQAGQWQLYDIGVAFGGENFAVATGDPLIVAADANAAPTFAWLGDVPEQGSISYAIPQNSWHVIMIPLDTDVDTDTNGTATANELANHIGGVTKVGRWVAGQWEIYDVGATFAGGTDFEVRTGYPYLILTTGATPSPWP